MKNQYQILISIVQFVANSPPLPFIGALILSLKKQSSLKMYLIILLGSQLSKLEPLIKTGVITIDLDSESDDIELNESSNLLFFMGKPNPALIISFCIFLKSCVVFHICFSTLVLHLLTVLSDRALEFSSLLHFLQIQSVSAKL